MKPFLLRGSETTMPEPLYRYVTFAKWNKRDRNGQPVPAFPHPTRPGMLVLVEPCEHGNIDRHFVKNPYSTITGKWCLGAGIGGDDGT